MRPTLSASGADAFEALRAAEATGDAFVVMLLDFMMPDMDGAGVLQLLGHFPELAATPVLVLSSADDGETALKCRQLGARAYLRKPISQAELLPALLQVLGTPAGAEQLPPAAGNQEAPIRSLRILLVEDNRFNQKVITGFLRKTPHHLDLAENGREGLERLAGKQYDLVLMDVQMPVMGGVEATAAIRQRERDQGGHLPIVALTAHAMQGDRERFLAAGMDGYLAKPVEREELLAVIRAVAEQATLDSAPVAVAAGRAGEQRLDPEVLANLKKLEAGGHFPLADFIQLYTVDSRERLAALRAALEVADAALVEREAHTLKGNSRQVGARHLAALCQRIEELGEKGALGEATALLGEVETELALVHQGLKQFVAAA